MSIRLINNRYLIEDTLNSDDFSAVYTVKDVLGDQNRVYVVNEFKERSVIDGIADAFFDPAMKACQSFVESFELDSCLYAVFQYSPGRTLGDLLSGEALKVMDKMALADSLLSEMAGIDALPPLVRNMLCDLEVLTVTNKKDIAFSGILYINADPLNGAPASFITQLGNILAAIYTNAVQPDLEAESDTISPAIYDLIGKCLKSDYTAASDVYKDFKSMLLYRTFVEEDSSGAPALPSRARSEKASPSVRKAMAVIAAIFVLSAGIFYMLSGHAGLRQLFGKTAAGTSAAVPEHKLNTKLLARFTPDSASIYAGDEVVFVNQSSVTDPAYSLQSYDWTLTDGEGRPVALPAPHATSLSYRFETEGNYTVSLVARDANGDYSESYAMQITIYPGPTAADAESGGDGDRSK